MTAARPGSNLAGKADVQAGRQLGEDATRYLFFTGKGGVGKTSLACATAIALADQGARVLLVSTDPASNLDEVLGAALGTEPTPVAAVPRLAAMNLDPEAAAHAYRERMVGPYRGVLPEAAVRSIEEQFSGSCTLEIAAFDAFAKLLGDPPATAAYDHVVFDTAPTGHTLRLLTLPSAWSDFIATNTTGTSCLGPLAGLQAQQQLYRQAVTVLADPAATTVYLVVRPEPSTLQEAGRTSGELQRLGVHNQQLVVNGIFSPRDSADPLARAMAARGEAALAGLPEVLQGLPRRSVALAPFGMMGVPALRRLLRREEASTAPTAVHEPVLDTLPDGLASLIDELATRRQGVVLTMGKGGVGKTTVASAVALALADRGLPTHLTTTDPAAHVTATLAAEHIAQLTVGRIDPVAETEAYTAEVLETAGGQLDEAGRALLAEDLRSPCTEEIAVFRAFARAVAEGTERFVVLDTAPTGHTILLLDAALAYHREVTRQAAAMPESVVDLLPRLRDAQFTQVLLLTLPAATPVHEAAKLQEDLRRAEIEPFAWVINQSLSRYSPQDPWLVQRRCHEGRFVREVIETHARKSFLIPWQPEEPRGASSLRRLVVS